MGGWGVPAFFILGSSLVDAWNCNILILKGLVFGWVDIIADQAIGVPGEFYWTGAAEASASCPMAKRIVPD